MPMMYEAAGDTRTPPPWAPEMESGYPFRHWLMDVATWSQATSLEEQRKAPAVVLRLSGTARQMARELDNNQLAHGVDMDLQDGRGVQRVSGLAYLLQGLARRLAPPQRKSIFKHF